MYERGKIIFKDRPVRGSMILNARDGNFINNEYQSITSMYIIIGVAKLVGREPEALFHKWRGTEYRRGHSVHDNMLRHILLPRLCPPCLKLLVIVL